MSDFNGKSIAKAIAQLFKKLFGKGASADGSQTSMQFLETMQQLKNKIDEECDKQIEAGEPLRAYMLQSQMVTIDAMTKAMMNGTDAENASPEKLQEIMNDIEVRMEMLNDTDAVKFEFQDYHNHDPELLKETSDLVNSFVTMTARKMGIDPKIINSLNSSMRESSNLAVEHMSESPQSHNQNIGLSPTDKELAEEKAMKEEMARQARQESDAAYGKNEEMGGPDGIR